VKQQQQQQQQQAMPEGKGDGRQPGSSDPLTASTPSSRAASPISRDEAKAVSTTPGGTAAGDSCGWAVNA